MPDDEDPIVGAGGANKPEQRDEGDTGRGALPGPAPKPEPARSTAGKHRKPDDE